VDRRYDEYPPAGTTSEWWGNRTTGIVATGNSVYIIAAYTSLNFRNRQVFGLL